MWSKSVMGWIWTMEFLCMLRSWFFVIFFPTAEHFSGRTDVQCLHRWQKVLNPELVKGPWTKEVSLTILSLSLWNLFLLLWLDIVLVDVDDVVMPVYNVLDSLISSLSGGWLHNWDGSEKWLQELVCHCKVFAWSNREAMSGEVTRLIRLSWLMHYVPDPDNKKVY